MKRPLKTLVGAASILLGILSAGMGLHAFLMPSRLIDGGVSGVSMLLADALSLPLPWLIPIVNLPFIALGYRHLGRAFAARSAAAILGLSLCLATVPFPAITSDKLLTAVFGGLFLGAGVGLSMRGGAVLDGTEILALLISKRSDLLRVGDVILLLNVVIFLVAALVLGVEPALYSILTYAAAAKTLDFILHGIEEYTAIHVVSDRSDAIRRQLLGRVGRGVTVYKGRGGLSGADRDILFCVVTRLEIGKVKAIVNEVDKGAFVVVHPVADVQGGVLERSSLHAGGG